MEEEPKNITHTDEPKGAGGKRKPRTKKDGNTDQRSIKNQKNMSHARSELQKYIHAGKAEKIKTKKEEPEEEEDDLEIIFALPRETPKVKQPENKTEEKENKKNKVKELEELLLYGSMLQESLYPPSPSPSPSPNNHNNNNN